MKKVLLTCLLISTFFSIQAQVGINSAYRFNNAPDLKIIRSFDGSVQEYDVLSDGLSFGIDVWFRLKNYRIEFLPELNYGQYNLTVETDDEFIELRTGIGSLFLNTHIYFLDFVGDCNCPTFSKQGPTISKGLFLQISPGISYTSNTAEAESGNNSTNSMAVSIAGGLGIDIGITEMLTITPFGGIRYFPRVEWNSLSQITEDYFLLEIKDEKSSLMQPYAGIRLGFRFDKENY